MTFPRTWTDERITRTKSLWAAGASAAEIANELGGVTRNAVIGKLHRLGLTKSYVPRLASQRTPGQRTPRKSMGGHAFKPLAVRAQQRRAEIEAAAEAIELPPDQSPDAVAFFDLKERHCRWPLWTADTPLSDQRFCGAQHVEGLAYCPRHCRLAFQTVSERRAESEARRDNRLGEWLAKEATA